MSLLRVKESEDRRQKTGGSTHAHTFTPPTPRHGGYGREHEEITEPLRELFAMVREVSAVVTLECDAFG